jgi:hypothetical protein
MDITFPTHMVWWLTAIEIPITAIIFAMFWRNKRENEGALADLNRLVETRNAQLRDSLAAYKLEVAKSYTSVSHLLRIESKLDRRTEIFTKEQ